MGNCIAKSIEEQKMNVNPLNAIMTEFEIIQRIERKKTKKLEIECSNNKFQSTEEKNGKSKF